jgi:hypothetical protein
MTVEEEPYGETTAGDRNDKHEGETWIGSEEIKQPE